MISKLIEVCVQHRLLVLLLAAFLVTAGLWSTQNIKVDAIPDLSDVQVILRSDFAGQSPRIIEDQVTYPLATAMLSVPKAKVVRGYSMVGVSFVYILFDDGTDPYWARSRVLERLSFMQGKLPAGVEPQLGPDATSVGWVYQYVLTTGPYSAKHPQGLWHDAQSDRWYDSPDQAPIERRIKLQHQRTFAGRTSCPLTGEPLVQPDIDLSRLRGLQDWYLRYGLTALDNVSEVASVGGFEKQYQIIIDPLKLQAVGKTLADVTMAVERSNSDIGARLIELSETEYMVRGLGYLGRLSEEQIAQQMTGHQAIAINDHETGDHSSIINQGSDEPGTRSIDMKRPHPNPLPEGEGTRRRQPLHELRTQQVMDDLRRVALGSTLDGKPLYLDSVAHIQVGPEMRRGIADWNGQGETVGGIVLMRHGENARITIQQVKAKLTELTKALPPGVAVETAYDRSELIDRAVSTLTHALLMEITVVALVCILFLLHARSELVAVCVVPMGVLTAILLMYLLGINANIMSLGGIAIAIGVMVDSSIIMVENAHKHIDRAEDRLRSEALAAGEPHRPIELTSDQRQQAILTAAREVGPSLFFALLILTVSFLPVFVLGEQSGRLFKPLAYTKTFAMAAASFLAVTVVPVLMTYLITSRMLPRSRVAVGGYRLGWLRNLLNTLAIMFLPAWVIYRYLPLGELESWRLWLAGGWVVLLGMLLVPQKIIHEQHNPISWVLQNIYHPFFVMTMRFRLLSVVLAGLMLLISLPPLVGIKALPGGGWLGERLPGLSQWFPGLGSEFMPPLEEGDLLYMPTTDPGISATKARELLQQTDALMYQFPEVVSVMGKAGQAETATDPAPISMLETTILLHRDKTRWRHVPVPRFFDDWPDTLQKPLRKLWPQSRPITVDELVYGFHISDAQGHEVTIPGMNQVLTLPGVTNAWTMPIRARIDMLATGIRTPVGVKVMGDDLTTLAQLSAQVAELLKADAKLGAHTVSAFAEKSASGYYLDIHLHRDQIARYGLTIGDVQDTIATAIGGMMVTTTVEGRERYSVLVRYPPDLRDDIHTLRQVLVALPMRTGGNSNNAGNAMNTGNSVIAPHVPLGQLADFTITQGPDMIKSENARLTSWVYVDITGIDLGTYVAQAKQRVAAQVQLPQGYDIVWSGQYEYWETARKQLIAASALTAVVILLLLYLATQSWFRVMIVCLALPFSLIGAVWMLYLLDYNLSLAVIIGMIALAGLDAETGLVMLLYLDNSYEKARHEGRMRNSWDLWHAVHQGAVQRIRPKTMTVMTTFIGLLPLMWAEGAGADTMRRLAAPMIGGLASSFILELLLYPVVFTTVKEFQQHTGWSENQVTMMLVLTLGLGLLLMIMYNANKRRTMN